jgi:hypothetical protein
MRPRHVVPATKFVILHNPGPNGEKLAADIFAPAGSIVLAPLGGKVEDTSCPDTPTLPGCQIRGYLLVPGKDGKRLPFVAAHLQRGSFPAEGQTFTKGQTIGKIERWEQHPASTHTHWAFRQPGDSQMPPPATIPVLKAFELCGPPPGRAQRAGEVAEVRGEPLHD